MHDNCASMGSQVFSDQPLGWRMTTRPSASLAVHGEVKRGYINAAPKALLHGGGEARVSRPEFFTNVPEAAGGIHHV